jgi:hypothetical protein
MLGQKGGESFATGQTRSIQWQWECLDTEWAFPAVVDMSGPN